VKPSFELAVYFAVVLVFLGAQVYVGIVR